MSKVKIFVKIEILEKIFSQKFRIFLRFLGKIAIFWSKKMKIFKIFKMLKFSLKIHWKKSIKNVAFFSKNLKKKPNFLRKYFSRISIFTEILTFDIFFFAKCFRIWPGTIILGDISAGNEFKHISRKQTWSFSKSSIVVQPDI